MLKSENLLTVIYSSKNKKGRVTMKILKTKDYEQMSRVTANILSAQVIMKPRCVLGLATGSTPIGAYRQLIDWYEKGDIDLQLLGLGNNGHIGFNEPGAAFEKETHCVDLTQSTINANARFFSSLSEVPKQAYTMGIKTIMQAKKIVVAVSGAGKAGIVREAFFGPITPQVPASVLQLHNDVTIVGDAATLSEVTW